MSKAEPLQIPLNVTYKDLDGNTISSDEKTVADGGAPLTLKKVLLVAVTADFPEDQKDPANIMNLRIKTFEVYQKLLITTVDSMELTPEDAAFLKQRVARAFGVLVSGPSLMYLSGKNPAA